MRMCSGNSLGNVMEAGMRINGDAMGRASLLIVRAGSGADARGSNDRMRCYDDAGAKLRDLCKRRASDVGRWFENGKKVGSMMMMVVGLNWE